MIDEKEVNKAVREVALEISKLACNSASELQDKFSDALSGQDLPPDEIHDLMTINIGLATLEYLIASHIQAGSVVAPVIGLDLVKIGVMLMNGNDPSIKGAEIEIMRVDTADRDLMMEMLKSEGETRH